MMPIPQPHWCDLTPSHAERDRRPAGLLLLWILACVLANAGPVQADSARRLADVPAALHALAGRPRAFEFVGSGEKLPVGGHLQGIQMRYDAAAKAHTVFISHDSLTEAYFVTVRFPESGSKAQPAAGKVEHLQRLPSDGKSPPLRHAGGIQLLGDVLAVGVEDNQAKLRSQIQFWDVSDSVQPRQLTHLTIARSSDVPQVATAGAVGLARSRDAFLLAVGNWDCRTIDFYRSNAKPLTDPDCRFELTSQWRADEADTSHWRPDSVRGTYQAIHLLEDSGGRLCLLGFDTTPSEEDVVDVFAIDLGRPPAQQFVKVARQSIRLADGCHFRFAGGASVTDGHLTILAGPRNFATTTRLSVTP